MSFRAAILWGLAYSGWTFGPVHKCKPGVICLRCERKRRAA